MEGKHWIAEKNRQAVPLEEAWKFLTGKDARILKSLCKSVKVRIINLNTDEIVGDK